MPPAAAAAMLAIVLIATAAILLLRRATAEKARLIQTVRTSRPDPPVVQVRSPAFVATTSGARYHVGCIVGEHDYRYGLWTTRSHRVVKTFESTASGWSEAWDLYIHLEHDEAPSWLDHRGAPRSRREWTAAATGTQYRAAEDVLYSQRRSWRDS
jgi:hypothetical protein